MPISTSATAGPFLRSPSGPSVPVGRSGLPRATAAGRRAAPAGQAPCSALRICLAIGAFISYTACDLLASLACLTHAAAGHLLDRVEPVDQRPAWWCRWPCSPCSVSALTTSLWATGSGAAEAMMRSASLVSSAPCSMACDRREVGRRPRRRAMPATPHLGDELGVGLALEGQCRHVPNATCAGEAGSDQPACSSIRACSASTWRRSVAVWPTQTLTASRSPRRVWLRPGPAARVEAVEQRWVASSPSTWAQTAPG